MQNPGDNTQEGMPIVKDLPKRPAGKGKPPRPDNILGALTAADGKKSKPAKAPPKKRTEPLNFRVTAEFRRAFKRAAAAQDCKKVDLLEQIFNEWTARNEGK